ncbi:class II fructose-bisphosphate aldolase [Candidatus Curtissbacteria bacterium]|nr:class II fructose-bisphosphate aldolase [Candidatus Curtissbacteria bacterium]
MTLKDWFDRAQKENFAIGAFNIDNLEIFKAVLIAAKNKKSPVIVQFSPGEVGYFGLTNIVDLVINALEEYKVPILLNLDHGAVVDDCLAAIDQPGFDLVHFDGSSLEFAENAKITKKIVDAAHSKGIWVEGEINKFTGSSEVHSEDLDLGLLRDSYTNPMKVSEFIQETKIDIFAPCFGNVHGTFPNQPPLDFALLENIRQILPNTFLSLHGGSGIPAQEVKEAIKSGKIVKVNVNTELRQAYKRRSLRPKLKFLGQEEKHSFSCAFHLFLDKVKTNFKEARLNLPCGFSVLSIHATRSVWLAGKGGDLD